MLDVLTTDHLCKSAAWPGLWQSGCAPKTAGESATLAAEQDLKERGAVQQRMPCSCCLKRAEMRTHYWQLALSG